MKSFNCNTKEFWLLVNILASKTVLNLIGVRTSTQIDTYKDNRYKILKLSKVNQYWPQDLAPKPPPHWNGMVDFDTKPPILRPISCSGVQWVDDDNE